MMKKLGTLAVAALLLTGCGAQASPDAEPSAEWTPTITGADPNNVACRAFAKEWSAAVNSVDDDTTTTDWDERADGLDEIASDAEGDVKSAMLGFITHWPDMNNVFIDGDFADTNVFLGGIEDACAKAGEPLDGLQLVASD